MIPTSQWNSGWNSSSNYSGWDPKAPIAYATTTGSSLTFHNACAILKVTITGDGSYAIFTISANEPLAGTFSLDTSTGTLTPTSGSTTVTVGNGIYANSFNTEGGNKTAYIAIAPGTYTNFKLHLYNEDDDDKPIKKSGSVTFEAGKIYDLGSYYIEIF
ncbi:MAG: fimbrillin family protein [Prevotella sp.]|nr:fimbrillin family protein [Prevotella sp.]